MSSERKIRASQLNGARSHGPVTPAGRLKSSANSARHHLLSKTILLENERPEAFADLLAGLTREFNPQTETQRALVETMAISRWRQMRIWAVERATLSSAMEAHDRDTTDPATRVALAFRSLADDSRTLDVLSRYETRFDRQFARSLNLLIKLDPLRRTGLPAGPSAEGAPLSAQNDFCQTNLFPILDTAIEAPEPSLDSGAGLPVCTSVEGAPSPEDNFCQTNLIPQSDTQPAADVEAPAPTNRATESAPLLAHFPTFIFDEADTAAAAHAPLPHFSAHGVTSAAAAASILDIR